MRCTSPQTSKRKNTNKIHYLVNYSFCSDFDVFETLRSARRGLGRSRKTSREQTLDGAEDRFNISNKGAAADVPAAAFLPLLLDLAWKPPNLVVLFLFGRFSFTT